MSFQLFSLSKGEKNVFAPSICNPRASPDYLYEMQCVNSTGQKKCYKYCFMKKKGQLQMGKVWHSIKI